MQIHLDRENAPTEPVITRQHHRIATLGNPIIIDRNRTQLLPRLTWQRATAKLIREKTKRLRRLISKALDRFDESSVCKHSSHTKGDFKMSQSQALQTETDTIMTKSEAAHLALIEDEEKILTEMFFKTAWSCNDYSNYTQIVNYNHHEPHEDCTGNLLIAEITGKPVYRRAISRLIARSPSMLAILEKALPIIEEEAQRRDFVKPERQGESNQLTDAEYNYYEEMRELANEIKAEIKEARGKGAQ